ncbi:MAG: hypothetical protein AB8B62_13650 [Roseobacter sp.]
MKTTLLGGVLFLAPLAVVALLLGKAYSLGLAVAKPLDQMIPIQTLAGVALLNILAVCIILAVCFLAGFAARRAFFANRMQRIDGLLIDVFPGYAIFKGVVGGVASDEDLQTILPPVLVRFDDYEQIAFEVEKGAEKSVVFLPGSPSAWSGTSVIVENARVQPLNIQTHQAVKLMRVLGRGALAQKTQALPAADV